VSKLAILFLTEPNVSDNSIINSEENRKYWIEIAGNILARDRRSIIVAKEDNKNCWICYV